MARKGDRAYLEPEARRRYVAGETLSAIAEALEVSVTSLARWKADTAPADGGPDEWARARQQRISRAQRVRDLYDGQLEFVEGLRPAERTGPVMDSLSKLGALVERMDKLEAARAVAADVAKTAAAAGLTEDTVEAIRKKILGIGAA